MKFQIHARQNTYTHDHSTLATEENNNCLRGNTLCKLVEAFKSGEEIVFDPYTGAVQRECGLMTFMSEGEATMESAIHNMFNTLPGIVATAEHVSNSVEITLQ